MSQHQDHSQPGSPTPLDDPPHPHPLYAEPFHHPEYSDDLSRQVIYNLQPAVGVGNESGMVSNSFEQGAEDFLPQEIFQHAFSRPQVPDQFIDPALLSFDGQAEINPPPQQNPPHPQAQIQSVNPALLSSDGQDDAQTPPQQNDDTHQFHLQNSSPPLEHEQLTSGQPVSQFDQQFEAMFNRIPADEVFTPQDFDVFQNNPPERGDPSRIPYVPQDFTNPDVVTTLDEEFMAWFNEGQLGSEGLAQADAEPFPTLAQIPAFGTSNLPSSSVTRGTYPSTRPSDLSSPDSSRGKVVQFPAGQNDFSGDLQPVYTMEEENTAADGGMVAHEGQKSAGDIADAPESSKSKKSLGKRAVRSATADEPTSQEPESAATQTDTASGLSVEDIYRIVFNGMEHLELPMTLRDMNLTKKPSGVWADALAVRYEVSREREVDPLTDQSLRFTIGAAQTNVHVLMHAIDNMNDIVDSDDAQEVRFVKNTSAKKKRATCIAIMAALVHRCIAGFEGPGKQEAPKKDMALNCINRLDKVCETLKKAKTACRDVLLSDEKIKILVHQPTKFGHTKKSHKQNNDRRTKEHKEKEAKASKWDEAQQFKLVTVATADADADDLEPVADDATKETGSQLAVTVPAKKRGRPKKVRVEAPTPAPFTAPELQDANARAPATEAEPTPNPRAQLTRKRKAAETDENAATAKGESTHADRSKAKARSRSKAKSAALAQADRNASKAGEAAEAGQFEIQTTARSEELSDAHASKKRKTGKGKRAFDVHEDDDLRYVPTQDEVDEGNTDVEMTDAEDDSDTGL